MGPATSSAALLSEPPSFGSLASMGGRKFKKKPVLVLDADELEKAHLLFQQDAAEQLGEFVPEERDRSSASLFGLAPLSLDDEDDAAIHADDDDFVEDADLPAPEKVLALTRPTQRKASMVLPFGDAPEARLPTVEPETDRPAEYYRDIGPGFSTFEDPQPAAKTLPEPQAPAEQQAPAEPVSDFPLEEPATFASEPELADDTDDILVPDASSDHSGPNHADSYHAEPEETAPVAIDDWVDEEFDDARVTPESLEHSVEPVELALPAEYVEPVEAIAELEAQDADPEDLQLSEALPLEERAHETPAQHSSYFETEFTDAAPSDFGNFGEEAPEGIIELAAPPAHNSLRARLVREDVCLARPEPSLWRKIVGKLRRIWWNLTFR